MADNGALAAPRSISEFQKFVVNRPGWEIIRQGLYDRQAYPAAGATQLNFFTAAPGGRTLSDTNMTLAGQLPTNQNFLIQSIEILFFPTTPTVAAQMPAVFGAQAVAAIINDAYIFRRAGNLNLNIGSKSYLQEAPLGKFPASQQFHLEAAAADVSTAGANFQTRIAFADMIGRPYLVDPNITLVENQNFSVSLNWPEGVQAITNPASVYVTLAGVLARRSQ